jgi:hypothetical protein
VEHVAVGSGGTLSVEEPFTFRIDVDELPS